jgi:recombinational DNA repair ATPase RecF
MILAATDIVQTALEKPLLLLIDDPAAELDAQSLARLMNEIAVLGCQVIATALVPDLPLFAEPPLLFHVEHGLISQT